jgi:N-methylhydantoinase A
VADWRLAVDIGGTFTDVVLFDGESGSVVTEKTLTTPSRPLDAVKEGVLRGLSMARIEPPEIRQPIVHATTLVTNALIEGKTARTALVTTAGFADTLLIRNEHRYDMYDLQIEFPDPPVPRELTFEIDERTSARGEVLRHPSAGDIDALAESLSGAKVDAAGVCLLHSYANPTTERAVARGLADRLGIPVCASSDVAPQIREYPRMVTTACNAATMPVVGPYLDEFQRWLEAKHFGGSLLIMLSNGGLVSTQVASRNPIRMVESGPAAGVLAGIWYAKRLNETRLLCLDMGGTTAKSCLVEGFAAGLASDFEIARVYRFKRGSGFPITVPSVDVVEIGAGGGSVARIDELGLLKVGPDSAGADPGPACYGRGGTEATVTDADLAIGHLDAGYFLGGDMPLDGEAAERAIAKLSEVLGTSIEDTAGGVYELVNQNMAASARMHAVERGVNLRGVSLIAFGGAGPVHACGVAELLEAPRVIFPENASVLSAFGVLVTPVRIDLARSLVSNLAQVSDAERERVLDEMRDEAREVLTSAGVAPETVRFRYGIDARYFGQGNEITVWVGEGDSWPLSHEEVMDRFARDYKDVYGMTIPDVPVEAVTWRVSASAVEPDVEPPIRTQRGAAPAPKDRRPVRFERTQDPVPTPVYERSTLPTGALLDGPALIEERATTAVLRPGWRARVTDDGSLVAERSRSG